MPKCGSQITCCDLPVRVDSYRGCDFLCSYCYGRWHGVGFQEPRPEEGVRTLKNFMEGERRQETNWCDWPIPLHWGGISDPFQPCELKFGRSKAFLFLFAEYFHPVVISTKSTLFMRGKTDYPMLLHDCNAVLQVSMVSPDEPFATWEKLAPAFKDRLTMLYPISKIVRRLIVRIQPYTVEAKEAVLKYLPVYAASGVHGIVIEGMKSYKRTDQLTERVANVMTYPEAELYEHYEEIKYWCHDAGLRFYCGENRLRYMSDHPTCCGCDGLAGFQPNVANTNYDPVVFTPNMKKKGTGAVFRGIKMETEDSRRCGELSYKEAFRELFPIPKSDPIDKEVF